MKEILTIVIPVYNGEKFVARAVESVINQPKGEYIKVLLINDGSKDSSGQVCDSLSEKYGNVCVIHKENGGVSSARNRGIQNADTKYIGFLDCDDWWENDFLDTELLEELSKEDSFDIYQFAYQEMDSYCRLVKRYDIKDEEYRYNEPGFDRYDWSHHCCFFYKKH